MGEIQSFTNDPAHRFCLKFLRFLGKIRPDREIFDFFIIQVPAKVMAKLMDNGRKLFCRRLILIDGNAIMADDIDMTF